MLLQTHPVHLQVVDQEETSQEQPQVELVWVAQ